jgi:hypothetical protein
MSAKAADLSKCGITTIWLPPPTQSVAPQGKLIANLSFSSRSIGMPREGKSYVSCKKGAILCYETTLACKMYFMYMQIELPRLENSYFNIGEFLMC